MQLDEVHCLKTKSEWSFINILQLYLMRTVDIHSKYSCNGTERVNTWDLLLSLRRFWRWSCNAGWNALQPDC